MEKYSSYKDSRCTLAWRNPESLVIEKNEVHFC